MGVPNMVENFEFPLEGEEVEVADNSFMRLVNSVKSLLENVKLVEGRGSILILILVTVVKVNYYFKIKHDIYIYFYFYFFYILNHFSGINPLVKLFTGH